ncbi:MAG TPA: hypothetical protein DIU15_05545 [Deltaproteobacteria bacterium]|nr:hypothetical protein [Deltaproteobacteria bacterium]HCP45482.1 hypothetical protein [Deltaproteobacteria bacterium]
MMTSKPLLRIAPLALALSACQATSLPSGAFTALSYNVHGLPSAITGDDTTGRMEQIAPLLPGFEVLGIQEDFMEVNHAILEADLPGPTSHWFSEPLDSSRVFGSGLSLFATFEDTAHRHEHYTTCNGTLDAASDCMASKGFQAIRLSLAEDVEVDVYNTHLEAGGSDEDNAAREAQIEQLIDSLHGWSAGRAIVFLGDFNLRPSEPEDAPLLDRLLDDGALRDSCDEVGCDEPDHIDRVLLRSGAGVELEALAWAVQMQFVDDDGLDLSDHPAVSAEIGWRVPDAGSPND